jgi:hypothetical protein
MQDRRCAGLCGKLTAPKRPAEGARLLRITKHRRSARNSQNIHIPPDLVSRVLRCLSLVCLGSVFRRLAERQTAALSCQPSPNGAKRSLEK